MTGHQIFHGKCSKTIQQTWCFQPPVKFLIERSSSKLGIPSMYGIFTYIWLIFMGDVGKYTIHGLFGQYHV